ncbi:MAG: 4Fe-4S dicluster domain-containing protein [Methyloligellaceae bacterium]
MALDAGKLKAGLGLDAEPAIHTHLCRSQIASYEDALDGEVPVIVACTQEAPLFREIAEEHDKPVPSFVNIRERAGWCENKSAAQPKITALLAEAALPVRPAGLTTLESEGVCLVYGAGQKALETAERLASRLNVSLILTDTEDVLPPTTVNVPIYKGRITHAAGTLGAFEITVDGYAPAVPSSKSELGFIMPRDGATSTCYLIFDMSGGASLFPAADRRDGYFHVDPNHPASVAEAMFEISDFVGAFEKPLYVTYDGEICAHGRSGKVGCTNCLDNCPVSAIAPEGDTVKIDHGVCGGCGNCSAVCPTGAVSYAYPDRTGIIQRLQTLISTYLAAGGQNPVLLFHDESHGSPLISASARFGRGLPVNVLPISVFTVTQISHEILLAAFASGAETVLILASPKRSEELAALDSQIALSNHILEKMGHTDLRARIITENDPDAFEAVLFDVPTGRPSAPLSFDAIGSKRDITRTILAKLNEAAPAPQEVLPLPAAAPYGRVHIDTQGCTLCLACVSACPADALTGNPEQPQVRFTEQACVQCGLCKVTCPESVISLEPRYNFTPSALQAEVLNEEEPFTCVRCGNAFGTKATVERVIAELEGKHSMFQTKEQSELIRMCDTCRIETMAERQEDPMQYGERPRLRTTEEYLAAEEMAKKTGKTPDDFLN